MGEAVKRRSAGPCFRQQVFNWSANDKYTELKHFEMEVMNIFPTKHYDISDIEKNISGKTGWGGRITVYADTEPEG